MLVSNEKYDYTYTNAENLHHNTTLPRLKNWYLALPRTVKLIIGVYSEFQNRFSVLNSFRAIVMRRIKNIYTDSEKATNLYTFDFTRYFRKRINGLAVILEYTIKQRYAVLYFI